MFAAAGLVALGALGWVGTTMMGSGDGSSAAASAPEVPPIPAVPAPEKAEKDAAPPAAEKPTKEPAKPAEEAVEKPPEQADKEPAADEPADEPAATGEAALFKVSSTNKMESCEEMLGKTADDYASTVKWKAAHAWKIARKNLMAGKEQVAAKKMCESAFIDPVGPALAGLVNYYLSKRAVEQAHDLAKRGLDANPESRVAKESMADVLSQMGKVDEARKLWLETFKLSADDTKRLGAVSRALVKSAVAARKGGDSALAERMFRRALAFDTENSYAAALFASVLAKNEQPELAKRWAEKALELSPKNKTAQAVLKQLG